MAIGTALLDDLAALVGGQAREAGPDDQVGGVPARVVVAPASTDEAAAVLRACDEHDLAVVFRGQGTALHWGAPPSRLDVLLDTARLDQVVEHVAGDLVAVVQAGLRLDDLNAAVGEHGQQLALDQPRPGASVGGTLATARSGARRVQYGAPRDLVLGVTLVRADGVVAHAGGKVVKNVAGYDLAKLVTGAYGTLGLVTEAVFRLHPLPARSRWLSVPCTDPADAARRAQTVTGSQLMATAVEVRRDPGDTGVELLVLLEGTDHGVDDRTPLTLRLLGQGAAEVDRDAAQIGGLPGGDDDLLVKLAVPLAGLADLLTAVVAAESAYGVPLTLRGSAGVGVLHASAPAGTDVEAAAAVLAELRAACRGGSAVLLQAPPPVRARVDAWGPVPGLELMRRVKDQYDPRGRLAPGRFVGGI
jgi:glycolate oxidase FAD binding subunit